LGQTQLERFVERGLLSADREEEERVREEGAEENFVDPIPKNNSPASANLKLKVLQLAPTRERFCMRTWVSYAV